MKKSCNGCRALNTRTNGYVCDLGYKLEQIHIDTVYLIGAKPLEKCPKPKTYDKWLELHGFK